MEKSKVYFINLKAVPGTNLLDRLEALVKKAGMLSIDFQKKFTAIKIHFGEPGNVAYLRPNFAARIAQIVRAAGGTPFLTDANTLYKGRRSNAPDHIQSAYENGYNPFTTGCHVLIADGLKGTDYTEIEVNGKHIKKAKIGKAITDADVIISMNHFKGHEVTGFGGALKNLGMGSASIGGKMEMHSASKPMIIGKNCTACRMCVKNCAHDAIRIGPDKIAVIDYDKCVGCGQCVAVCMFNSAQVQWGESSTAEKIAEYTKAVIKDKPNFHINFVMNVSPNCDCWPHNDAPIVPDLGILASFDPVAIDRACVDMVNDSVTVRGSVIGGLGKGEDKFKKIYPNVDWKAGLDHAEAIGLGTQDYEKINL